MQRRVFVSTTRTEPVGYRFRACFPPGSHLRLSRRTLDVDSPHSYWLTIADSDTHQGLELVISPEDAEKVLFVALDIHGRLLIQSPPPQSLPPQTDDRRPNLVQLRLPETD